MKHDVKEPRNTKSALNFSTHLFIQYSKFAVDFIICCLHVCKKFSNADWLRVFIPCQNYHLNMFDVVENYRCCINDCNFIDGDVKNTVENYKFALKLCILHPDNWTSVVCKLLFYKYFDCTCNFTSGYTLQVCLIFKFTILYVCNLSSIKLTTYFYPSMIYLVHFVFLTLKSFQIQ